MANDTPRYEVVGAVDPDTAEFVSVDGGILVENDDRGEVWIARPKGSDSGQVSGDE